MIYFYKMFISFLVAGFFSTHAFAWSEGIVKGGSIKGTHINEFRNLINLKRQCLGLSPTVWTDASITTRATPIRAQHFIEIKNSASEILSLCPNSTATYACTVTGSVPGFLGKLKESFKGSIKASDFNFMRNYLDAITCTPWTYGWLVGSYGACAGGSGIWSYSPWGICSGTTRSTTYGGWGACVADMETRSVTTADVPNSGSQGRTGICNGNFNSGTQTRTVQCQRSDGLIVADSFCTTPSPCFQARVPQLIRPFVEQK